MSMANTVRHYLRFLEVIRSLNCEPAFKSGVGRKEKKSEFIGMYSEFSPNTLIFIALISMAESIFESR